MGAADRDAAAFAEGYELGWAAGIEAGRAAALYEAVEGGEDWRTGIPVGVGPSAAELAERRRHTTDPCDQRCERCTRCTYAAHYARHGEYSGQPPAPPARDQLRARFGFGGANE